jgi:cellobiose-specific phosphotransferase system component IIC
MKVEKKIQIKSVFCILMAAFCWALPPTLGKFIVDDIDPFIITTFRLGFSIILFLPFFLIYTKFNVYQKKAFKKE